MIIFKFKTIFSFLLILFIFSGCSLGPGAYTGSKSDGIVSFSYTTPPAAISEQEWNQANSEANSRCQNWGYRGAIRFDRSRRVCTAFNAFGCVAYEYYVDYQCVD